MNAPARLRTLIVPPTFMGRLSGVMAVSVGIRSVHVQLLVRTVRIRRKTLPSVLPSNYMELAALVLPIARCEGIEVAQALV